MGSIEVQSSVMCDEVRREASGQATLIGARSIGPPIAENETSTISRIAFYLEASLSDVEQIEIRLHNNETGDTPVDTQLNFDYKEKIKADNPDVDVDNIQVSALLVVSEEDVEFKGSGEYDLQYRLKEEDWTSIRRFLFPKKNPEDLDE